MVARTTDVVSRAVKDEMIAKDQGAKVRERSSPEVHTCPMQPESMAQA